MYTLDDSSVQRITDAYVPVGAYNVSVADVSNFKVGDIIFLRRTPNQKWINDIGTDQTTLCPTKPLERATLFPACKLIHRLAVSRDAGAVPCRVTRTTTGARSVRVVGIARAIKTAVCAMLVAASGMITCAWVLLCFATRGGAPACCWVARGEWRVMC